MKKLLYSFAALMLAGSGVMAQNFSCHTDHYHKLMVEKDPSLAKDLKQLIANSQLQKSDDDDTTTLVIPVVFHILHENGVENIPDANLHDAIAVLNRDYKKQNADANNVFGPYADKVAKVDIEFKLAAFDPQGNCTNGINRIFTHETNLGENSSKLNQWDRKKYLNVWIVKRIESGAAGYAIYPTNVNGNAFYLDGIVLLYNYVGRLAPSNEYNSRSLTHEVGHWLALPHVWGSTNEPTVACGDDGIYDTPETKGHDNCTVINSTVCDVNNFTNARYSFDDVTTTSGIVDPTAQPNQLVGPVLRIEMGHPNAVGVGAQSQKNGSFAFNGWGTGADDGETVAANMTGAMDASKYYEVTITPQDLQSMTFTRMTFDAGRNATGARSFIVRSSIDNYATNLVATSTNTNQIVASANTFFFRNDVDSIFTGAAINLNLPSFAKLYNPITFRIYGYNAEDADGTFRIDNLTFLGTYGTIENVENYMEYSYCSKMFTEGQRAVMRTALRGEDGQRFNLITAENHEATGINLATPPVCIPKPAFSANRKFICSGQSVTFTDKSYNGAVVSREWTFQDGTPATSTAASPVVTFNTPGAKTITLKVVNSAGEATETFINYIDVAESFAAFRGPKTFDFEEPTQYQQLNYDNVGDNFGKFGPTNYGFQSNGAVKLGLYKDISNTLPLTQASRYYENLGGQVDAIITPTFDLRYTTGVSFSFDYSYATNAVISSEITEKIKVYFARDCSENWVQLGTTTTSVIEGAALISGGLAGGSDYAPVSSNDWKNFSRPFNATSSDSRTRFKIEFTSSDLSNNLYIDNIMIGGTAGIADDFTAEHELVVSPNPVVGGGNLNIQYVAGNEPVTFTLRNLQGEAISTVTRSEQNQAVSFGFNIAENIAASYYFLEVTSAGSSTVKKIAVIK